MMRKPRLVARAMAMNSAHSVTEKTNDMRRAPLKLHIALLNFFTSRRLARIHAAAHVRSAHQTVKNRVEKGFKGRFGRKWRTNTRSCESCTTREEDESLRQARAHLFGWASCTCARVRRREALVAFKAALRVCCDRRTLCFAGCVSVVALFDTRELGKVPSGAIRLAHRGGAAEEAGGAEAGAGGSQSGQGDWRGGVQAGEDQGGALRPLQFATAQRRGDVG
eukprot:scaffold536_cov250-Pinguiococcus_pyrenoidosus.AAC.7